MVGILPDGMKQERSGWLTEGEMVVLAKEWLSWEVPREIPFRRSGTLKKILPPRSPDSPPNDLKAVDLKYKSGQHTLIIKQQFEFKKPCWLWNTKNVKDLILKWLVGHSSRNAWFIQVRVRSVPWQPHMTSPWTPHDTSAVAAAVSWEPPLQFLLSTPQSGDNDFTFYSWIWLESLPLFPTGTS